MRSPGRRRWRGASTRQRFWLAIARPAYDDDRLSLISLTGSAGLASEEDPVAGLFIDGWTEGIPRRRVPTDIRIV